MGANISHHKRHQEKVISSKKSSELNQHRVIEVAGQKYMACEQRISCSNESKLDHNLKRSTEIVANKTPPENNKAEGIFFDKQEEENNRDIKKANNNPTSLVITICMLKMENSEKMIVEQSASNCSVVPRTTPKCRCYETSTDGASSTNSTLNNLNKSNRNSHLNIICDNNNGNSLINNDKSEENENLLNNNSESDHILNFNLDNKFDNLTLNSNEVNDNNNSDEIYNQINDCPVLQLSGGSIISMDMDGFKIPGFNDEKILNTSILSGTSSNCCHQSSLASASSCCRKKSSSSSSKNSNRKSCKCGSPSSSSKESSSSSSKSKKGNWAGLKFNCAKLKNNNVKPNNSFPSTSTTSFPIMETRRTPEESCICTSYRKVDDFHLNSSPISHHELALLNAQRHIIHRTVRPSGDFLLFLNHGAPMLNISRFNEEFISDDERVRGMETGQHSSTVSHPQSLFFCTHSPCPSSPEPSLLHKRLLDNELNPNANDIPHTRIHSQVDFEHFLVPDLQKILACSYYWAKIDRYEAEKLLDGKPEGTFLLRDSAQEEFLFSVSFRKYNRSLHARIEQFNHKFSFDSRDPGVYTASTVTGLLEHYKDPTFVMFFEPMLTQPLNRNFCFSLQQLCRASIVSHTTYDGVDQLCLPKSLKTYLKEYHYRQRVRVRPVEHLYTSIM